MSELDDFQVSQANLISTRNAKAEELKNKLQSIRKKKTEIIEAQQIGSAEVTTLQSEYNTFISQSNTLRSELNSSEDAIFSAASEYYGSE